MNIETYVKYALTNKLYRKIQWFYSTFAFLTKENTENEYVIIKDNKYHAKLQGSVEVIDGVDVSRPMLSITDVITVDKSVVSNVSETVTTTLGRIFANKILLADTFTDKIPFIDGPMKSGSIEDKIAKLMLTDVISVKEYIDFVDSCSYIQMLSRITTVSGTPKGLLPPPGIAKYKKEANSILTSKYGEKWHTNKAYVVEYENMLKKYDAEWMKDDPTDGKLTSGKVKDSARTKMYLTFGAEAGFDKKSGKSNLVENSLLEGFPKDRKLLTTMFNTSRAGSFDRGKETQKGGSAAKDILRATSGITITNSDCGSRVGKSVFVTSEISAAMTGRYIIDGNKLTVIDDGNKYIGKTVIIRTPMYCLEKGSSLCPICVGNALANYKTAISIIMTDISAVLLAISMAAMHFKAVKTMSYDMVSCVK